MAKAPTHRVHFKSGRAVDFCDVVMYEEPGKRYYLARSGTRPCSDDNRISIPFENVEYVEELL